MRVYIVGGAASGKTSLAEALSARLDLPVLRLDDHLFAVPDDAVSPRAQRREPLVAEWTARDGWVIEGAYPSWVDGFARAADIIVWLDVPYRAAARRALRRHVLADLRRDNRFPGYVRLLRFLLRGRHYYRTRAVAPGDPWELSRMSRAYVAARAAEHPQKLLRLTGGSRAGILRAVLSRLAHH